MKIKNLLVLLMLLCVVGVTDAQDRFPKREFRGAGFSVNGQFQGMYAQQMQQMLTRQLDYLQGAGINAVIFR